MCVLSVCYVCAICIVLQSCGRTASLRSAFPTRNRTQPPTATHSHPQSSLLPRYARQQPPTATHSHPRASHSHACHAGCASRRSCGSSFRLSLAQPRTKPPTASLRLLSCLPASRTPPFSPQDNAAPLSLAPASLLPSCGRQHLPCSPRTKSARFILPSPHRATRFSPHPPTASHNPHTEPPTFPRTASLPRTAKAERKQRAVRLLCPHLALRLGLSHPAPHRATLRRTEQPYMPCQGRQAAISVTTLPLLAAWPP